MRVVIAFFLSSASLAACGEAVTPAPVEAAGAPDAAAAALKGAAEQQCAELTNYSPKSLETMSAEMQALTTREFKACVEAVTRGETAPPLRGRS